MTTIDHLQSAYGFTKMPFGRDIAPQAWGSPRRLDTELRCNLSI